MPGGCDSVSFGVGVARHSGRRPQPAEARTRQARASAAATIQFLNSTA